jgi:hypothetical protein
MHCHGYRWTGKVASKDLSGNAIAFITAGGRTTAYAPALQFKRSRTTSPSEAAGLSTDAAQAAGSDAADPVATDEAEPSKQAAKQAVKRPAKRRARKTSTETPEPASKAASEATEKCSKRRRAKASTEAVPLAVDPWLSSDDAAKVQTPSGAQVAAGTLHDAAVDGSENAGARTLAAVEVAPPAGGSKRKLAKGGGAATAGQAQRQQRNARATRQQPLRAARA